MSHFTQIETQFKNRERLVETLVELGVLLAHIEIHDEAQQLYTYDGAKSAYRWNVLQDERFKDGDKAHVIVRRKHVGKSCNDLGFYLDESGESVGFVCDYATKKNYCHTVVYDADWMNNLKQKYAIAETVAYHEEQGDVVEVVTEADGNVYIYAT